MTDEGNSQEPEGKRWWESQTIRNAVGIIIVQALNIGAIMTGKVFDIEQVKFLVDNGLPLLFNSISLFMGYRVINGRKNATQPIVGKK